MEGKSTDAEVVISVNNNSVDTSVDKTVSSVAMVVIKD